MRGHIRKRGKNSWSLVVELGRDPLTGTRRQKWITVRGTRKQAEARLSEVISSLERGAYVEPTRDTIAEYLAKWLEVYAVPNVSENTLNGYTINVRKHIIPYIGRIPLKDLRPAHVQELYSGLLASGLSPKSVRYVHTTLHEALKHAVRWELIPRNVTEAVTPPRVPRHEITVLEPRQVTAILKALQDTRLYMPVLLAVSTGMRRGEIFGLRWPDVNFERGLIHIARSMLRVENGAPVWGTTKTEGSRRSISLPAMTIRALREHERAQDVFKRVHGSAYRNHGLVVCLEDGRAWDLSNFASAFRRAMDGLGFKGIRFHDLRHTHATMLLKEGVHPKIVSERLGHATVQMTLNTYSHVLPEMQKEAASRIDDLLNPKDG